MPNDTKNLYDVVLTLLTLASAGTAFVVGLLQWRRSQAWQRADKLDKFVDKFESNDLLRLAAVGVDWGVRKTRFGDRALTVSNEDALPALRNHDEMPDGGEFEGEQPTIRDAYDALLAFFQRLEVSIKEKLIDARPAKAYFAYWLEHFLYFEHHPDEGHKILTSATPKAMVAGYIKVYGDPQSIKRLCRRFEVEPPHELEGVN